jgi:hypothetical protein
MAQMVEAEDSTIDKYCAAQIERMGTPSPLLRQGCVVYLCANGLEWGICMSLAGVDAEGFQLDLGLLPRILKLTCHTWMVQRNNKQLCQITR